MMHENERGNRATLNVVCIERFLYSYCLDVMIMRAFKNFYTFRGEMI